MRNPTETTGNWDVKACPMNKAEFGVWEVTVPANNGQPAIPHNSKIKVRVRMCVG